MNRIEKYSPYYSKNNFFIFHRMIFFSFIFRSTIPSIDSTNNSNQQILYFRMGNKCCTPDIVSSDTRSILYLTPTKLIGQLVMQKKKNILPNSALILPASKKISYQKVFQSHLTYSFYINYYKNQQAQKQINENYFWQIASKSHPEMSSQIQSFKATYNLAKQADKNLIFVQSYFTHSFIQDIVSTIPLKNNDPKYIGTILFPITRLYEGIKKMYSNNNQNKNQQFFIPAFIDSDGELKIMANQESCFSFSIFMRGFTNEQKARQRLKKYQEIDKKKSIFFHVNFPFKKNQIEQSIDFGYYVYPNPTDEIKNQGDVIFNIYNFFQVTKESVPNDREYDLNYAYLPRVYHQKYIDRILFKDKEPAVIKIYEIKRAIANHYLKSQSCLFRIIKNNQESISLSQSIIRSANQNGDTKNEIELQNLITSQIEDVNFQEALNISQTGTTFLIRAKKIQVLYELQNFEQVDQELNNIHAEVEMNIKKNLKSENMRNIMTAIEICEFIYARRQMATQKFESAKKRLTRLQDKMKQVYGDDVQFIGKQVISSIEECDTRRTNENSQWNSFLEGINIRVISSLR